MASSASDRVLRPHAHAPTDLLANALRILAMDAVQKANSGHPGAPMGMAEMAVALWHRHLKHDPADPAWPDRDRFVLSNGHASMLLYALLHLSGYDLPLDELKRFRQLHSKTPGHPEVGITPGVETTTGPLGQGLANAVGMALAERRLAAEFNRPGHELVDHFTYVFLGDGCLMEGISHEACSLAGTLKLGRLIVLYDDNGISIDGAVEHWFADDSARRFAAYGWNVIGPIDGHDVAAVDAAIATAKAHGRAADSGPSLIVCRTAIGRGAPTREGTAKAHGEPLGADEIAATRAALGWGSTPFDVPPDIAAAWRATELGAQRRAAWLAKLASYRAAYPELAAEFERRMRGDLPSDFDGRLALALATAAEGGAPVATRKASQLALAALAPSLPEMLGGSADLTGSNLTDFPGCGALRARGFDGRHINYGVREFGMAAIMNGLALHGGFIPYGGTFLTFSDYSRNAIRMAALMKQRVVHVFTHDSIGLGEDGPTHQAVEHAASLRLIPNLDVWRPADPAETMAAWGAALQRRDGPSALLLSRQALPAFQHDAAQIAGMQRGGYVLREDEMARVTLIGTGSELSLCVQAADKLAADGIRARVVSLPSTTVFDRQDRAYREAVLGRQPRIAVEAGVTLFWAHYRCDVVLGVDRYGESAPAAQVYAALGLTVEALVDAARRCAAAAEAAVA